LIALESLRSARAHRLKGLRNDRYRDARGVADLAVLLEIPDPRGDHAGRPLCPEALDGCLDRRRFALRGYRARVAAETDRDGYRNGDADRAVGTCHGLRRRQAGSGRLDDRQPRPPLLPDVELQLARGDGEIGFLVDAGKMQPDDISREHVDDHGPGIASQSRAVMRGLAGPRFGHETRCEALHIIFYEIE